MGKNCNYILETNSGIIEFKTEFELENYLLNNKNGFEISDSEFHDIVFSENTAQREVYSILKKNENKSEKILDVKFNKITGDMDPEGYGDYKGVTRLLNELKQPGTETFLATPFNIQQYRENQTLKLIKSGENPVDAALQIDEIINSWEVMAEMGTEMHKIAEYFFKDYTVDQIKEEINIQDHILADYIYQLNEFKKGLLDKYGENTIFLAEYKVSNDDLKMVGIIDLLVIDESGQVHLYDFKTSHKASEDWYAVKEQTYDYQLGFYRHALAAYGIPVKKADLGIIPIQLLDSDYNSKTFQGVKIENIQNRLERKSSKTPNRLEWNIGRYYNIINHFIPIKIQDNVISSDFIIKVNDDLKTMFPQYQYKTHKSAINVESFKKNHVKLTERGDYTFFDKLDNKSRFFKNEEELELALQNYFKRQEDSANNYISNVSSKIQQVLSKKADLSTLVNQYDKDQNFFPMIIKKYMGPNWNIINVPELETLGIIAIQNTTSNYIDFLTITSSRLFYDNPVNLGLGDNIVGAFEKNITSNNPKMLKAHPGNLELIKIMTAINNMPDLLNNGNIKIGDIRVINTVDSQSTSVDYDTLLYTFNRLALKAKVNNNFKGDDLVFLTNLDSFYDTLAAAIAEFPQDTRYNTIMDLYETNAAVIETKISALEELRDRLLHLFPHLKQAKPDKGINTPELYMYYLIHNQIMHLMGITKSQITKDISRYNFLSGAYMNNPDTQRDENLRQISTLVNRGFQRISDEYLTWNQQFRKLVETFKEKSGYGAAQENILGFQNSLYKNLFVKDPDTGEISKSMMFKDPTDNSLLSHEKIFLEEILFIINKYKDPSYILENKNDPRIDELKANHTYYQVPLMRATGQSKIQDKSIYKDSIKKGLLWFKNPIKMSKKAVDGVMNKEEDEALSISTNLYDMYNRFQISETNRDQVLSEHDVSYFEKNLEDLVNHYEFARIRRNELNKVLPVIQGIVTTIRLDAINYGLDISKYNEYLDDTIKSHVFSRSLVDDEMKGIYQLTRTIKRTASTLALGFNFRSGIREVVQGLWKNIGASMIRHYGEEQFTTKDYTEAMKMIIGDTPDFLKKITTIESLNIQYRMANMDVNGMVEKVTSNKKGMAALGSRGMFWMTGSPDYLNRMSIFIAQMIKDGSWDAHKMVNEELIYDWKKDKRFEIYSKGLTNHSDYKLQRSRYLKLLEELNNEGVRNKDGSLLQEDDDLIRAYSSRERDSLKSFANMMFGYYDHEDKALINNLFFGSLWLQFRTFFSATKNKYLLSRGQYQQGKYVHMKDENGNLLYYKRKLEDDGSFTSEMTTEEDPEAIPLWDWEGRYMEGIFTSLKHGFSDWYQNGWDSAKSNFMNDPVKMNNMKQFAYDMALWSLFALLMAALIKSWTNERNKERKSQNVDAIVHLQDGLTDMLNRAMIQSVDDFFIGSVIANTAFDWQPPAFKMIDRLYNTSGEVLFGNKEVSKAVVDNVGALGQIKRFWYNTIDMHTDKGQ